MLITMFKSKIHRATLTGANVNYEGSIEIDGDLLDSAQIKKFEQVHVWNVTNGQRLVTYALRGLEGTGKIEINGAGALLMNPNDLIIIATFIQITPETADSFEPTVVLVDEYNKITNITNKSGGLK